MKATRILAVVLGCAMVAAGIWCVANPQATYLSLGYAVGVSMIVDGIGGIALWAEGRRAGAADGWALAGAVASLAFGALLMGSAAMQVAVDMALIYLVAAWLVVAGSMRVVVALRLRRLRRELDAEILGRRWWLVLAVGILLVVCGVTGFIDPSGLVAAAGAYIGLGIVASGVGVVALAA